MTTPLLVPVATPLRAPGGQPRMDADAVGGKAAALARLAAAGERVPAWMVIPADALLLELERAGVLPVVERTLAALARDESPAALRPASCALQRLVRELPRSTRVEALLADACRTLGAPTFAVRSSAVGEDGASLSFAGQLDTVLGVSADGLYEAVCECWLSAFGERVLDYRRRAGALADAPRVAVIVQRMVVGDVSGVLFTADPVTGDAHRMRVSACPGLGDALVSGDVNADEYLVTSGGDLVESRCVAAPVLNGAQLRDLTAMGRRIAEREGGPRDIEWTMCGGELFVLQARPITSALRAAPAPAPAAANRIVWDNSNIEESYCGVTTPLTFSFASAAYASVYEQTMRIVGIPERVIVEHQPLLRTLLGLLRGRVYYNLNSWYGGLLLLPAFQRNKADMERMMGVTEPVDFVDDERLSASDRLRRLPRLARTMVGLLAAFSRLDREIPRFLAEFDARIAELDRPSLATRPLAELMPALDRLWSGCIERWTTPIVNDFRVMMATGRLRRFVAQASPDGADALLQALLGGADAVASAGPATLMLGLANIARSDPAVTRALAGEADDALRQACAVSPAFAESLAALMQQYGDRCMGELKLESRPLRDDTAFVVRMIRNYLHGELRDPSALAAATAARAATAVHDVAARLPWRSRRGFRRALAQAQRGIRAREEMRLARTRLFGAHRDVYRAIGARLHEAGQLDQPADVHYLTTQEIRDWWSGTFAGGALAPLARARRAEFASYEADRLPNRIVTTGAPHDALAAMLRTARPIAAASETRVLRGLGCSAGVVEGRVRIVRSATDDLELNGHILVAPRTDPGWAPLFPSARAIVVERGSLLSHSAVLARELGLPAVVGVPGVVDLLRDGELVRVNGIAGTIERLEAP